MEPPQFGVREPIRGATFHGTSSFLWTSVRSTIPRKCWTPFLFVIYIRPIGPPSPCSPSVLTEKFPSVSWAPSRKILCPYSFSGKQKFWWTYFTGGYFRACGGTEDSFPGPPFFLTETGFFQGFAWFFAGAALTFSIQQRGPPCRPRNFPMAFFSPSHSSFCIFSQPLVPYHRAFNPGTNKDFCFRKSRSLPLFGGFFSSFFSTQLVYRKGFS